MSWAAVNKVDVPPTLPSAFLHIQKPSGGNECDAYQDEVYGAGQMGDEEAQGTGRNVPLMGYISDTVMIDRSSRTGEQHGPNFLHRRGCTMTVVSWKSLRERK